MMLWLLVCKNCGQKVRRCLSGWQLQNPLVDARGEGSRQSEPGGFLGLVGQWKEHFEEVLNLTNTFSWQEAKSEDLGEDSFISLAEVAPQWQAARSGWDSLKDAEIFGLGRFTLVCWKRGFSRLLNLRFRNSNIVITIAMERSLLFTCLYLLMPAGGSLGVCHSSLLVMCGSGEGLWPGFVGGTVGVCDSWPVVAGHSIPVWKQWELCSHSRD